MSKIRVYELAKKIGVSNQEVIAELLKAGVQVKTHSSSIEAEVADKIEKAFKAQKTKPAETTTKPQADQKKKAPVHKKATTVQKSSISETKVAPPQAVPKPAEPPKAAKPAAELKAEAHAKKEPEIGIPEVEPEAVPETEPSGISGKPILEEPEVIVPDRFKKEIEVEKVEKFKAKPAMQRAFQAVTKVQPKRWPDTSRQYRRFGKERPAQRTEAVVAPVITAPRKRVLKIHEGTTVKEFAELISVKIGEIIKKFMELGYMPTINQPVDMDAALLVAEGFGVKLEPVSIEEDSFVEEETHDVAALRLRPPVVTIMGHVDHGKTSLLDAVRETKVTETEAGGITQHIGAYKITLKGKEIVFLDTPGHEAFTALRARGAKVTDIVILVVAADDGVMPQTIEAIDHAKAANVPIIVAINKIDKPEANPSKVMNELAEHEIIPEAWGGKNIFVEVSAKQRIGIETLLEMVILQAEMMELKADMDKAAKGTIIEARLDRGRGPVATVLVQNGRLRVGDTFLSGTNVGKVRALIDDTGKRINEAGPSTPVEVIGFPEVPTAGDIFNQVNDEKKARQVALARLQKVRSVEISRTKKLTLDEVYAKIKEGEIKDLNIIIKGDVQGSVEALKDAFNQITHPEVKVRVIHTAVGGINESDVMLAAASNAIIIGFNVRPEVKAQQMAEKEGVDIRHYNIIYVAIDDVKKALEGMLAPTLKEKVLGRAEVRQTYQVSRVGTIAGSYVLDGTISRTSDGIRLIRDNIVVHEGRIGTLKRFKDDVKEVQAGYECGITIDNYNDVKVGDIIENFIIEKIAAKL